MAGKPPKPPDAFLSYTRFDDRHDRGKITEFCRRLASAVQAVTGVPFRIFQDVEGIGVGQHWRSKLDEMLNEARFFIPIVTASYFTSKACREELEAFLRAEADRGRNDLVLPIYYIECDAIEDEDLRAADPLASTLHERQREDWRELRFEPFEAKDVQRALERLAREIVKARRRGMTTGAKVRPPRAEESEQSATEKSREELKARAERNRSATQAALQNYKEDLQNLKLWPSENSRRAVGIFPARAASRQPEDGVEPGTVSRDVDAPWCPEVVEVPPGEFTMGSSDYDEEKPRHPVRIAYPLAVGRYPVTFEEYDHFARATGRAQPGDQGSRIGRHPVIDVDWEDAKSFAVWLSAQTGQRYRLLSEAEWEYACRAGTTTRYWWGDEITPENANYRAADIGRTSKVGSYPANRFGLYDTHGNVWEWVEDCWNRSYKGAPDDGSDWTTGDCGRRVLRGGCWHGLPGKLRSANRDWGGPDGRGDYVGFRVARTLSRSVSVAP
jgi:formylglycine-generating enzyme required for sulfatase activity